MSSLLRPFGAGVCRVRIQYVSLCFYIELWIVPLEGGGAGLLPQKLLISGSFWESWLCLSDEGLSPKYIAGNTFLLEKFVQWVGVFCLFQFVAKLLSVHFCTKNSLSRHWILKYAFFFVGMQYFVLIIPGNNHTLCRKQKILLSGLPRHDWRLGWIINLCFRPKFMVHFVSNL